MIVKANRDGSFYVANNGNWRLAGPFSSSEEAWQWIDEHRSDHAIEPENPAEPRKHTHQPRTVTDIAKADVFRIAPIVLNAPGSTVTEREFVIGMERRAKRTRPLKLSEKQGGWWKRLAQKYGGAA